MRYYFASDIHLGAGDTATARAVERRFVEWLDAIAPTAKGVFLLGDVFDFWFEYRKVVPQGFVRVLGRLARMTDKGIRVVLITGNHDMWVGDYLRRECGIEVYTKPICVELSSRRLFLAHGDNMNIKRQPMLRLMNWAFRSRVLRFLFSWLIHPDLAVGFGRWWSGSSRKSHGDERDERYLAPLKEFAANDSKRGETDCYIFGHMHIVSQSEQPQCYFLGDWPYQPNWLEMDEAGNITQKTE